MKSFPLSHCLTHSLIILQISFPSNLNSLSSNLFFPSDHLSSIPRPYPPSPSATFLPTPSF